MSKTTKLVRYLNKIHDKHLFKKIQSFNFNTSDVTSTKNLARKTLYFSSTINYNTFYLNKI